MSILTSYSQSFKHEMSGLMWFKNPSEYKLYHDEIFTEPMLKALGSMRVFC